MNCFYVSHNHELFKGKFSNHSFDNTLYRISASEKKILAVCLMPMESSPTTFKGTTLAGNFTANL